MQDDRNREVSQHVDLCTYIASIDNLDRAAQTLRLELGKTMEALLRARATALDGTSVVDIVLDLATRRGGRDIRDLTVAAIAAYEHAMTLHRSVAIRALVDDAGMTFSEVARLGGVSRQMIARLYAQTP